MRIVTARIHLLRSFSSASAETEASEDWSRWLRDKSGQYEWPDLLKHRVVVVLGEAGIGKTLEFENAVDSLLGEKKSAFFVPLNHLVNEESWRLVASNSWPGFERWQDSDEPGFFFLDAVDEARLVSHAAFEKALMIVAAALRRHMSRVHVVISSRITDWGVESVRESVQKYLVDRIEVASGVAKVQVPSKKSPTATLPDQPKHADQPTPFVVSLDPLSDAEAKRLAHALGVANEDKFWAAIDEGDYEFMATRPLDLVWMVKLWNDRGSLGTYTELIDANVANRLMELNPSYQQAGATLSLEVLRNGAEQLAAATEFSGKAFISTKSIADAGEVAPVLALSDWGYRDILRLVGSAIFDEATFGRVKFHHRSIREYLAASWVNQHLKLGVPLHVVLPLFVGKPFGKEVLIPSRRAALCWLAALNVECREWIAREFPEMVLFEGDPEAWDLVTADLAFAGYLKRLQDGLRTDWWNDASEFRRLARRLPPGRVATILKNQAANHRVIGTLLPLVRHGRLVECSQPLFEMYRSKRGSPRERRLLLIALATVASPAHRKAVEEDLLSGDLKSNELLAAALGIVNWKAFTASQLSQVFMRSTSESMYGPMERAIKEQLLPEADLAAAELLLTAILESLPAPQPGKRFSSFPEESRPDRAWLLEVLPDCTERLFSLLPPEGADFPGICLQAAERLEAFRDSGFADRDDLREVHDHIAVRPTLRWKIALELAQSEDIRHATNRLTWGGNSLVSFGKQDLDDLVARANDSKTSAEARNIWSTVGMTLAMRDLRGLARRSVLSRLLVGPDRSERAQKLSQLRSERLTGLKQLRPYHVEERRRKADAALAHARDVENFTRDIDHIRDGSHTGTLYWLISYSYNHSGRNELTKVDLGTISQKCSPEIAEALAAGLVIAWSKVVPPNPADYPGGQVPWEAIAGLAGLHVLIDKGVDLSSLSGDEIARAARLAVWELNGPPEWFVRLATTQGAGVAAALQPWVEAECTSISNTHRPRGALDLALRTPALVQGPLLQPAVDLLRAKRVVNVETQIALLNVLRREKLLSPDDVSGMCRERVQVDWSSESPTVAPEWIRAWFEEAPEIAWDWFKPSFEKPTEPAPDRIRIFANALGDKRWIENALAIGKSDVLIQIYQALVSRVSGTRTKSAIEEHADPIARFSHFVPQTLVQIRGTTTHRVLVDLIAQEARQDVKEWLGDRLSEHASLEAQHLAPVEPANLKLLGETFQHEPRNEHELFRQALSRLEEIRIGMEEGPFSERLLFRPGIPEKQLQLWLAAKFLGTTNRRFSVHREEVVDADNRTDVQLSCQHGNVCVEVKPLDKTRSYSAVSLADTLKTQIVGQYLKGLNSSHGILVLLRLDKKSWAIPGVPRPQHFRELVASLRATADALKHHRPDLKELAVFGIDCVGD